MEAKSSCRGESHGGNRDSRMEVRHEDERKGQRSTWLNWPSGPAHPETGIKMKVGTEGENRLKNESF